MTIDDVQRFYDEVKAHPGILKDLTAFATADPSMVDAILKRAKDRGYAFTRDDYSAFLEQCTNMELDDSMLEGVVGGMGDDEDNYNYNDTLIGGSGNDWLEGGEGNDNLYGDLGNDWLEGEEGNDNLYGDLGNDWLEGEEGNDVLFGGDGADTFIFALGEGNDTITDFDPDEDKLQILDLPEGQEIEISYENGNTILEFGRAYNGSITIEGVELTREDLKKVIDDSF